MVVDIDTQKLMKFGITAEDYFLLKGIEKRGYGILRKYYRQNTEPNDLVLQNLVDKKLIHNANKPNEFDVKKIIVRHKFRSETKENSQLFEEFYNLYPQKVTRPDGSVDYLRTDRDRCQKLYVKKVKLNKNLHTEIMEGLQYEIEERSKSNNLRFMKRMPKWLASEEWTIWREKLEDDTETMDVGNFGYGLNLE